MKGYQSNASGGEQSVTRIWSTAGSPTVAGSRTPSQADVENRMPDFSGNSDRSSSATSGGTQIPVPWGFLAAMGAPLVVGLVLVSANISSATVHFWVGLWLGLFWGVVPACSFISTSTLKSSERKRFWRVFGDLVLLVYGALSYVVWASLIASAYFYFATYTRTGTSSRTESPFDLLQSIDGYQSYGGVLITLGVIGPILRWVYQSNKG